MDWWLAGKGEVGPEYCKCCTAKPNPFTKCKDCPQPEILPENSDAIELFARSQTQWRYAPGTNPALDYVAVKVVSDALGFEWNKDLLASINVLEKAYVKKRANNVKAEHGNA